MATAKHDRNLDLLYEIGTLRNVPRGWRQHLGIDCASVLEHTVRVILLSLVLARLEKTKVDEAKIIKMALIADLTETRTSDLSYVQKVYVQENDSLALKEMLAGTVLGDLEPVMKEYKARKSIEAKIVKDADNLDIDIELKEAENIGHKLPKQWKWNRKFVRDTKLYTRSAKKLWNEIQKSNPQNWHMKINKWVRIPSAGK